MSGKSNHKHQYKPIILQYEDPPMLMTPNGFPEKMEYAGGSVCKICQKIRYGFPKEFSTNGRIAPECFPDMPIFKVRKCFEPPK